MGYRILSLDGGGAWALIQVRALMELYGHDKTGHDVLADFDMVAANSGGSLVLGGLVENLPLEQILAYFKDENLRKTIFAPSTSWFNRTMNRVIGIGPKYSTSAKLPAIRKLLPNTGDKTLESVLLGGRGKGRTGRVHLLILGFDYDRNRAAFFRSATTGSAGSGWGLGDTSGVTVAEAIHASANPPVNYFDAPAAFPGQSGRYWDGGLTGCNNPSVAAVTEAVVVGAKASDVAVLSIGTATVVLPWPSSPQDTSSFVQKIMGPGLVPDLRKLATSVLDDPPDIASFLAHVMTGGDGGTSNGTALPQTVKSHIVRMNPLISPEKSPNGSWAAPGPMTTDQFNYLVNLDMDAVDQVQVDAIDQFAALWLDNQVLNQPIRMNGDTLKLEIGQDRFAGARAAWEALKTIF